MAGAVAQKDRSVTWLTRRIGPGRPNASLICSTGVGPMQKAAASTGWRSSTSPSASMVAWKQLRRSRSVQVPPSELATQPLLVEHATAPEPSPDSTSSQNISSGPVVQSASPPPASEQRPSVHWFGSGKSASAPLDEHTAGVQEPTLTESQSLSLLHSAAGAFSQRLLPRHVPASMPVQSALVSHVTDDESVQTPGWAAQSELLVHATPKFDEQTRHGHDSSSFSPPHESADVSVLPSVVRVISSDCAGPEPTAPSLGMQSRLVPPPPASTEPAGKDVLIASTSHASRSFSPPMQVPWRTPSPITSSVSQVPSPSQSESKTQASSASLLQVPPQIGHGRVSSAPRWMRSCRGFV